MNYIPLVCHSVHRCTPVNSSPKKGSVASSSAERESNPLLGMLKIEQMHGNTAFS